jgi:dienelactone hydrolase
MRTFLPALLLAPGLVACADEVRAPDAAVRPFGTEHDPAGEFPRMTDRPIDTQDERAALLRTEPSWQPDPTPAERSQQLCEHVTLEPQRNRYDGDGHELEGDLTYHATAHLADRLRDTEVFEWEADLASTEAYTAWRDEARGVLADVLRLDAAEWINLPHAVRTLESETFDTYRRDRIDFVIEPGLRLPAYLFVPTNRAGRLPGVLVIHGHGRGAKEATSGIAPYDTEPDYQNQNARRLAEAGYVVLAPDVRSFGTTGSLEQHEHFAQMLLLHGRVAIGQFVADMQRALDVLAMQPEVDDRRLGVAGTSLGGQLAQLMAVFDPRIKAAVVQGFLASYRDTSLDWLHCVCQYIPMMGRRFDFADVAMLAPPTPVLFVMGDADGLFPPSQSEPAFELIATAYSLLGLRDNTALVTHPSGHVWVQSPAEQFLAQHL